MLTISESTESTTRPGKGRVGVDDDSNDDGGHINGGGGRNGDFDMTFQVTRWRSGHCSSAKTIAFDYAFEADYQERKPIALN